MGNPKGTLRDILAAEGKPAKAFGRDSPSDLLSLVKAFLREVEKAVSVGGLSFEQVEEDVWER